MPVVSTLSNHFKFQLASGNIDFDAHTFKIILMDDTFAFDKDAHATLADISASEIPTGNGYTQQNKTLANVSVTEDDANDKAAVAWDDVTWTASGGDLGGAGQKIGSAVIYDDDAADDTVIGCIDFGTDYTIPDSSSLQIQNIKVDLT